MTKAFPYRLTGPIGTAANLGLIVLQADETIEQDFRRLFRAPEVAVYVSRIPSGAQITPDTIGEMECELPRAAGLFAPAAEFDVIGYGCTSGTTLIGADRVGELVASHANTRMVTDPLSASFAAFEALGVTSLAIVSPYVASVAEPMRRAFEDHGLRVRATLSFGEKIEARVARIDPASIYAAGVQVASEADVDAVFLSCTNLRTLDIIDPLEQALGCPVVSSNQALAWQMGRLAGLATAPIVPGRLSRL